MKLEETKFTHPHDKDIFKALKRTIKDKTFLGEILVRRRDNSKLVHDCYLSRTNHKGEGVFTNYMYWPGDIGIGINSLILGLIWVARVINIIGKENITPSLKSDISMKLGQITNNQSYVLSARELVLLSDNSDIINNAISMALSEGETKKYTDVLIDFITADKKGIPY